MFEQFSPVYSAIALSVFLVLLINIYSWGKLKFKIYISECVSREIDRMRENNGNEEVEDYLSLSEYYSTLETSGWFKKYHSIIDSITAPSRQLLTAKEQEIWGLNRCSCIYSNQKYTTYNCK